MLSKILNCINFIKESFYSNCNVLKYLFLQVFQNLIILMQKLFLPKLIQLKFHLKYHYNDILMVQDLSKDLNFSKF